MNLVLVYNLRTNKLLMTSKSNNLFRVLFFISNGLFASVTVLAEVYQDVNK